MLKDKVHVVFDMDSNSNPVDSAWYSLQNAQKRKNERNEPHPFSVDQPAWNCKEIPISDYYDQDKLENTFLADTRDILVGYDGLNTVEGLKSLIDETIVRLTRLLKGEVTFEEVFGDGE